MNIHEWLNAALAAPPQAWAVVASALVGLSIPWMVEANVPMQEWSAWRFRGIVYGVAVIAGVIAGITVWSSWHALVMWVPALGVQVARDVVSHWLPWLSPRRQTIIRRDSAGNIVGVRGPDDDKTTYFPTVPKDREDKP